MGPVFLVLVVLWLSISFHQLSVTTADYSSTRNCTKPLEGCLRCTLSGDLCVKCRQVIIEGTRECRAACPAGRREEWPSLQHLHGEYMGRVCVKSTLFSGFGLNGHHAALLVGLLSGILLSVALLFGGVLYIRRRKMAALSTVDDSSESTLTVSPLNPNDRLEFIQNVAELRPEAPVFLSMLNDTRRQFREVSENSSNRTDNLQPFRSVIRDLGLILFLLHKPEDKLTPPADWRRLLSWGSRVLRRYRKLSPQNLEPVTELVSFLPSDEAFNTLSTVAGSTVDKTDNNNFCNDFNRFSFGAEFDAVWGNNCDWNAEPTVLSEWSASRDFIYDDNFIRLGFRPQDEITTEL